MSKPYSIKHPQAAEIYRRLVQGDAPTTIGRQAEPPVAPSTLRRWRDYLQRGLLVDPLTEPHVSEVIEERDNLEAAADNLRNRISELEDQVADYKSENDEIRDIVRLFKLADSRTPKPPKWLVPKKSSTHRATVNLVLSDLHLDEVVRPEEVNGVNAYNRQIALKRLERTFRKSIELPRDYLAGITYDGIVVHLAGDTFSGDIHEELQRTNEATPLESVLYWLDPMIAGLRLLIEAYGNVHVVSVPGNHDRTTRKPTYKGRVTTSLHFLFSKMLEREFAGESRITWNLPQAPDALTKIYNTTILTTHGDRFRGGGGIGGILVPILRGEAKTQQRQVAIGQPYDLLVMGHFHQYINGPNVLVNGSMKGYDEYSYSHSFGFEEPQQALFLVTPEHGPSFHMPIQCSDRKREGW